MSNFSSWDRLTDRAKEIIVTTSSSSQNEINKFKSQDIIDTIREAKFTGYDNDHDGAFKTLEFELEQRHKKRKWRLAVFAVVVAIIGVLAKLFV